MVLMPVNTAFNLKNFKGLQKIKYYFKYTNTFVRVSLGGGNNKINGLKYKFWCPLSGKSVVLCMNNDSNNKSNLPLISI